MPQTMKIGQRAQISATEQFLPPGSPAPSYAWSTDNPSVATVASEGGDGTNAVVTGVGAGTANIACMDTANNLHNTDAANVTAPPPELDLSWGSPS